LFPKRQTKSFSFYYKKTRTLCEKLFEKENDEKEKANQTCEDEEQMFVTMLSANDHMVYDWIIDFGATQHNIRMIMAHHLQIHCSAEGVHGR